MVSNFLMVILAITALVGALLVCKVAINMGNKLAQFNDILEKNKTLGGKSTKKHLNGAARNFAPSQFS
ncbi:MAG: hypothetical protein ACKVHL_02925 [Rhodospirillales bacterium]|jgi:hypothetical protein